MMGPELRSITLGQRISGGFVGDYSENPDSLKGTRLETTSVQTAMY